MNKRGVSPPFERAVPRGGANVWDQGPAGLILTAEFFGGPAAELAGAVTASSTVTGDLSTGAAGADLAGSVSASSSVVGALSTSIRLAGTVSAASVAAGALSTSIRLAGVVSATATVTGSLTSLGASLAGVVTGTSTVTGTLTDAVVIVPRYAYPGELSRAATDPEPRRVAIQPGRAAASLTQSATAQVASPAVGVSAS